MKLNEVLEPTCESYEQVYIDHNDHVYDNDNNLVGTVDQFDVDQNLHEAAKRQWKRRGRELYKRYRCLSGPKKGKLVADPAGCATRKDPKKVRRGRKMMRTKKNTIVRKSKISKRQQLSKIVSRMNKRLRGETDASGGKKKSSNK